MQEPLDRLLRLVDFFPEKSVASRGATLLLLLLAKRVGWGLVGLGGGGQTYTHMIHASCQRFARLWMLGFYFMTDLNAMLELVGKLWFLNYINCVASCNQFWHLIKQESMLMEAHHRKKQALANWFHFSSVRHANCSLSRKFSQKTFDRCKSLGGTWQTLQKDNDTKKTKA